MASRSRSNMNVDRSLNEETTKLRYITPVIEDGWGKSNMVMEYPINAGRIILGNNGHTTRGAIDRADYLLNYENNFPLAVVEAKKSELDAYVGYQQAVGYAERLDVPFAYATNGDELIEHDMITGQDQHLHIQDFPSREDLWQRYLRESQIPQDIIEPYLEPYDWSMDKTPRYYQRIIINRVMEAVLRGQRRILVVCATGTGKTYEAFQIIYRLWKSGVKKRVLYLADRNTLIDQTMNKDFKPFGNEMTKFKNKDMDTAHSVYLGIYQQFVTTQDGQTIQHFKEFPRDFFDLIIVDECHRSSANLDSQWHDILDYFSEATQIGMTATPKDDADPTRNNIAYFGEPIYTYSLKQGIDDGFLAPYEVIIPQLNVDQGWQPPLGMSDDSGVPLDEEEIYEQKDYDIKIALTDRHRTIAKYITDYLKEHNRRYDKTIVFCESIQHAYEMSAALREQNEDLCKIDPRYVTTIVAGEKDNEARLDEFTASGSQYPVIAVTSRLMSTGVDAKTCKLIVLDRSIGSMTEFKQIIGRGTRVEEKYSVNGVKESKTHFTIMDFRSNYLKFQDPDFDGEPIDVNVDTANNPAKPQGDNCCTTGHGPTSVPPRRVARVTGVDVHVTKEMRQWLNEHGDLVVGNLEDYIRDNIRDRYSTVEDFTSDWLACDNREELARELLTVGDWDEAFQETYGYPVDDYDIICDFGYQIAPPMDRRKRAEQPSVKQFIDQPGFTDQQRRLLALFVEVYANSGITNLRGNNAIAALNLPKFRETGYGPLQAIKVFGGKPSFKQTLRELERAFYEHVEENKESKQ